MKRRVRAVLGFGAIAGVLGGGAALAAMSTSEQSASYACAFEKGAAWQVADQRFSDDRFSPLSFELSRDQGGSDTAQLSTRDGKTDVKVVRAIGATHYIEVTVAGYLTLTTLYGEGDRVPAVHSRHLGIVGQPVGGQLHGFCERS
ncbi:MAG: hypothetical protein AAFQ42_07760 [Pseudomonadota bacterium]